MRLKSLQLPLPPASTELRLVKQAQAALWILNAYPPLGYPFSEKLDFVLQFSQLLAESLF